MSRIKVVTGLEHIDRVLSENEDLHKEFLEAQLDLNKLEQSANVRSQEKDDYRNTDKRLVKV